MTGNTVTVTSGYIGTYPNATYVTGTTTYVVGKTTVGMNIFGVDPDTGEQLIAHSITKGGKASFRLEYPANINTIDIGCRNPAVITDTRFVTPNSRQVWVTAQVDGNAALTKVDGGACFSHILPEAFTSNTPTASSGDTVTLTLNDAESVGLPFYTVEGKGNNVVDPGAIAAAGSDCITVAGGTCTVTVTGDVTDTITYNTPSPGGTAVVITIE